jgi:hypothetical protein
MVQAIWRSCGLFLTAALLMTVALAGAEPASADQGPLRPVVLGVPLHVGGLVGGVVQAVAHPHRNRAPKPDYVSACSSNWRGAACTRLALAAIEHALAAEGVRHSELVLPRNYHSLSVGEQTFVIIDLERVARGLKPFAGLTPPFNAASHTAAVTRVDPNPAISALRTLGISEYGSNWAGDFGPLASDYDWMYNDGYGRGGINMACLTPQSDGCWGHRDNILGAYHHLPTLLAGAGTGTPAGMSIAMVMTGGHGSPPKLTYTWRQARRHGAGAHSSTS